MSAQKYPHVFSPIRLGPVEVKNRFYFSPHGNPLSVGMGPSDGFAYYYAERAARRVDGRWYVEVLCKNGLIYPKGGDMLLAHCNSGVKEPRSCVKPRC